MARTKARVYTCCALILLLIIVIIVCVAALVRRKEPKGAFSKAAVAADSRTCSEIGRNILQRGGSAVDGAIAALLCTSVMNPQSAGLGGGSIFTVMDSSGRVQIINSRETVPSNSSHNLLGLCSKGSQFSAAKWIGVPGELRGYEEVHRRYGKLPWAELFQPTIKLAREGFPIPLIQSLYIQSIPDRKDTQLLRKLFSDKDGNLLKTGDTVKFEKLADTLETIAKNGAESFYSGKIAEDLVDDVREAGGSLTLEDLRSYNVTVTEAWNVSLGDEQIMYTPPPPAGGVLLSLILNIMKGYQMKSAPQSIEEKTLFYHRYIEAFKFAGGLKMHIWDPRFHSERIRRIDGIVFSKTGQMKVIDMLLQTAKKLIEDSFANRIRTLINDSRTHEPQYYNGSSLPDSLGTTHVSVLAEDGAAVSVTSTINHIFGSKIYSPRTGIILNNELFDFCGRAKRISPGERPPSSMAPSVLKSPSKTLVIGASGGSFITTGIASTLINHLWFGERLKEAIAAPIVFVDSKNAVKFEPDFDEDVIEALKARGHNRETTNKFYNVVNVVEKKGSYIYAVSDARKRGEAAGY